MNDNSPFQHPNDLTRSEYRELAELSAIHPALIERNFIHIDGVAVYSYLFISDQIPRKNAGRVTDGFLRQYQYAADGGLWISGLDPQNNWQPMEWGRFKPTNPRDRCGERLARQIRISTQNTQPRHLLRYPRLHLGL